MEVGKENMKLDMEASAMFFIIRQVREMVLLTLMNNLILLFNVIHDDATEYFDWVRNLFNEISFHDI